jgi:hypothetical protein
VVSRNTAESRDWCTVMLQVYDLYGCRDRDLPRIRDLMAKAAEVTFRTHRNEYAGSYYSTSLSRRNDIEITRNELEDEDGQFLAEPGFPQYMTLVRVSRRNPDPLPFLDDLRRRLEAGSDLVFLTRDIFPLDD